MFKFEVVYDPSDKGVPLKLNCPKDVNPALLIVLMSQIITALAMAQVGGGDPSGLIIPVSHMPRMTKQ